MVLTGGNNFSSVFLWSSTRLGTHGRAKKLSHRLKLAPYMCPPHVSYGFAPSEAEDHGPSCHQLRLDCRWRNRKPASTVAPFPVHAPGSTLVTASVSG